MSSNKLVPALPDIDPATALAQATWHGPYRCLALDEFANDLPSATTEPRSAHADPKWQDNAGAVITS